MSNSNLPNWLDGEQPLPPSKPEPPKKSGFNPLALAGGIVAIFVGLWIAGAIFRAASPDTAPEIAEAPPAADESPVATFSIPGTWTPDPSAPTPAPTNTPENTATPEPTNTPEPTPTEVPSPTPVPTATQVPTATPLPEPMGFNGVGDQTTANFTATSPLIIVEATHNGSGHFSVTLKDARTAENVDLAANVVGAYNGAAVVQVPPGDYFYEVSASGNWTVTTKLPGHLSTQNNDAHTYEFGGLGAAATSVFMLKDGRVDFETQHEGGGHFGVIVYQVGQNYGRALITNEIGSTVSTKAESVSAGAYVIGVAADGPWRVVVKQP